MKEYTILELAGMLEKGKTTTLELTKQYLERIYQYEWLHAVGEIDRDVLIKAELLDQERKEKGPRSILHGIPIIVKDNINVKGNLHTSAGSKALENLYAPYNATLVNQLEKAGMLIVGKANLSEFAYFMSTNMPCGFSSRFGQCVSPYDGRIDPLGSSTGSAVGVAANIIPVAIGTETNGSLMAPAHMNSIVSIKPTLGMISRYGILPISASQDTAGPMSRTVLDSAILMDALQGKDPNDVATLLVPRKYHFYESSFQNLKGKRIGLIHVNGLNYTKEEEDAYQKAKEVFTKLEMECIDVTFQYHDIENVECLMHEFKRDLNTYLSTMNTDLTLKDIIEINKQDPEVYMPYNQELLELTEKRSGHLTEKVYYEAKKNQLSQANELNEVLDSNHLDALACMHTFPHAAILGNPTVTVPAKALTDLTPLSIVFTGRKWDDDLLLAMAYQYEYYTHFRVAPDLDGPREESKHESLFWDVSERR